MLLGNSRLLKRWRNEPIFHNASQDARFHMSAFKTGPVVGDMGSFGSTPGVLEFDVHLVGLFSRQLQPCESGERGRIWGFEGCTRIDYAPPPGRRAVGQEQVHGMPSAPFHTMTSVFYGCAWARVGQLSHCVVYLLLFDPSPYGSSVPVLSFKLRPHSKTVSSYNPNLKTALPLWWEPFLSFALTPWAP